MAAAVYMRLGTLPLSAGWQCCSQLLKNRILNQSLKQRLGRSSIRPCSTKPAVVPPKTQVEPSENIRLRKDLDDSHVPSDYQRRILVHFKYFPDLESVPPRVSIPLMAKAMSQARIKVSISMMVIALILCFCTAVYGRTHMRENSLVEVNMRRHEAYKMGSTGTGGRMALVFNKKKEEDTQSKDE